MARAEMTGRASFGADVVMTETGKQRSRLDPDPAAFTIPEFCRSHKISRGHYYTLRRRGLGPDVAELLGRRIITHEAAARWRKQRTIASKRSGTASAPPPTCSRA
jgi:hypothetical protein